MSPSRVEWGDVSYAASEHARVALAHEKRSGSAYPHADRHEAIRATAERLIHLSFRTWGFGDSVAFDAMLSASDYLQDAAFASFAHGWGRAWVTRSRPFARLDCTAPGRALVRLAERFDDDQLLQGTRDLAEYLLTRPKLEGVFETWTSSPLLSPYGGAPLGGREQRLLDEPPPGVFVDCLHFDPPFFVELGRVLGEQRFVAAGLQQAAAYVRLLQQPGGLFDHFALEGVDETFGHAWGRGQGWAALGLLEVISTARLIEGVDADELAVLEIAVSDLLAAMMALQRSDGHWFAVVSDADSGEEYSTAAFMAIALAEAAHLDLVDRETTKVAHHRARQAVLRSLDAAGQLREVSAAVYASTEQSHYANVPRGYVVPWGQGPALLALLSEGER